MISHKIEVFYDGGCPVCRWEIRLYDRMDTAGNIVWTDIESLDDNALPADKTRADILGKFHVRDLEGRDFLTALPQDWHIGVDAFARIWRALPGLRRLAFLFSVPVLRQITMVAYRLFLKWQSWDRKRRKG